jgi:hypothetical protein
MKVPTIRMALNKVVNVILKHRPPADAPRFSQLIISGA